MCKALLICSHYADYLRNRSSVVLVPLNSAHNRELTVWLSLKSIGLNLKTSGEKHLPKKTFLNLWHKFKTNNQKFLVCSMYWSPDGDMGIFFDKLDQFTALILGGDLLMLDILLAWCCNRIVLLTLWFSVIIWLNYNKSVTFCPFYKKFH